MIGRMSRNEEGGKRPVAAIKRERELILVTKSIELTSESRKRKKEEEARFLLRFLLRGRLIGKTENEMNEKGRGGGRGVRQGRVNNWTTGSANERPRESWS